MDIVFDRWVGQRNGLLTVVSADRDTETWVDCKCDCGGTKRLRAQVFKRQPYPSCGCVGKASKWVNSPTYHSWAGMKQRCSNPNHSAYENYGGRGIGYCARWESFENFLADMGEKPEGMEIDRKNNSKGYSPENCRWVPRLKNIMNRRCTKYLTVNGDRRTWVEWAEFANITRGALKMRLKRGWSPEEAVGVQKRS